MVHGTMRKSLFASLLAIILCSAPALAGPDTISLMGAGGARPAAAVGGCSQATAFLARTSGLDATHQNAYTTMICGLVTDGIFTSFDGLYIFATQTQANALLNLVSSSFPVTVTGTVTFTADQGFSGSLAASDLDTGFNPSTAPSPKFVQDSATSALWRINGTAVAGDQWRQGGHPTVNSLFAQFTDTHMYCDVNASSDDGVGVVVATAAGLAGCVRSASTGYTYYKNGSSIGTRTNTSTAIVSGDFQYLEGTGTGDVAAIVFGSALNATQYGNLFTRVHLYMQTIAGVP